MKAYNLARYGLWAALIDTGNANRLKYHLTTAYLPHTLGNSVTLLFPDLLWVARRFLALDSVFAQAPASLQALYRTLQGMVIDNPRYVLYMAPAALGYILSHPQYTIYKGRVNDLRLAGFGPDNLIHAVTGFALVRLIFETLDVWLQTMAQDDPLRPAAQWLAAHKILATGLLLAALTLFWEVGEYQIKQSELQAVGGDESRVNMDWNLDDSLHDAIANFAGWFLASQMATLPTVASPDTSRAG